MRKGRVVAVVVTVAVLVVAGTIAYRFMMKPELDGPDAIGIQVEKNIRAVYQIQSGEKRGEVAAGLHHLKKLVDTYDRLGVDSSQRHLHGVFHGDAGHFLLEDEAYSRETGAQGENPNRSLVEELEDRGVHLELCARTMQAHGWGEQNVLDEVAIVVGAYPRVIDLQLSGYAYVRF
ncbi:MAG: DsrE family protein [Myxococcota bacterium]